MNSVTLRAWERRYGLIRPQRTPKGHRLYAQDDITHIERILQWLNRGVPVSQVSDLLAQPETIETPAPDTGDWFSQRQQLQTTIEALDLPKLETLYHQSLALYPLSLAINELWQPVILALEAQWSVQPDELVRRTFEAFLRSQVGIRLHYANQTTKGPLILLSAMPSDPGPLWVLLTALMASEQGYRVQLFDHALALPTLSLAVSRLHSSMVLLSSGQRESDYYICQSLPQAAQALNVPIGVCGEVARLRENELLDSPVHMLGDDLPLAIARLRPLLRESGVL